jgi:PKD repeat protein
MIPNTPSDTESLSYHWDFGDSETESGETVTHSYNDEGEYTITLIVMDNNGDTGTVTSKITVQNAKPVCLTMDSVEVFEDDVVKLTGTGTDTKADESKLEYSWDLGIADLPHTPWNSSPDFEYRYRDEGEYTAILTVRDDDKATASATVTITVNNVNPVAQFSVSYAKVSEDEVIEFDASSSSDTPSDIESLNYTWDFDDANPIIYGKKPIYSFQYDGTYKVMLTITDDNGAKDTFTKKITVNNVKPEAKITVSNAIAKEYSEILFSAADSYDSPSDISSLKYEWDFDDGTTSTDKIVSHNYTFAGSYSVTLTVTDDDSEIGSNTIEIRIEKYSTSGDSASDSDIDSTGSGSSANKDNISLAAGIVGALILVLLILLLLYIMVARKI